MVEKCYCRYEGENSQRCQRRVQTEYGQCSRPGHERRGRERERKEVQESRAEQSKRLDNYGQGYIGKRSWGKEGKVMSWRGLG